MANPPPSSQSTPIFPPVETNTLPQDLLLEILPRLPVKSLVRFQAVHTSWQSLFQNPNFISAHFRRSSLLSPRKVLVNTRYSGRDASFYLYGDTLDAVDTSEISNLIGRPFMGLYILVGSCNGVFCVTDMDHNKFLLWNPATRETMLLPPPLLPGTGQRYCAAVGFGLSDPQGGDLKIVRFMYCDDDEHRYSAEVYSLKSRCWRKIQTDLEYDIDLDYTLFDLQEECDFMERDNHGYCNGSYHWVNYGKMLSFDMTREVFEWGKLPRAARWWKICAGFSGCLLAMTPMDTSIEVWSMVGAKSWKPVKGFVRSFHRYSETLIPVCRNDDEVGFFHHEQGDLCFLNITTQEVREVRVLKDLVVWQLLPYVESLVTIQNSICV